MTYIRPPFPSVLDSTIVGSTKACEEKAFRMYLQHWKSQTESVHLVAGGAFARGLEIARMGFWDGGLPSEQAIALGMQALITAYGSYEPPDGAAKTLDRVAGAYEFYFNEFPMTKEPVLGANNDCRPILLPATNKHAIEFSFADPLPISHPETGDPLIYCGRFDAIADFASGIYGWDDKTASQLGSSWANSWDLRSQFTGYCWGAKNAGIPLNGFVVNGISILKTKYDKARAITGRAQWEIDRWLEVTVRTIERLMESWRNGKYVYNLDESCSSYGGCPIKVACKSDEPERWLPMYFERRLWDPLTRTETKL